MASARWTDYLGFFNELHIPCYVLFDYDNGKSDKKSKELLALAGISEADTASLFVDDSVACFPETWESHLRSEIPGIEALTAEARKELGISNDSGKPLIARYIARKITSLDPPIIPPSLKTIIERAVVVSWKGCCLKTQKEDEIAEK